MSNGEIAALYDDKFYVRSIYYPLLDQQHNHAVGGRFRVGIWKDGKFSWLGDIDHEISMENLVTRVKASFEGATVEIEDVASMTRPAIIRRVRADGEGLFRVIFYNDFRLNGTELGDTAFYSPELDAVVHYKGSTWFAVAASQQLYEYTVGRRDQGTVLADCEDGALSKNPIAQGSVDSAVSVASKSFHLYIVAGTSLHSLAEALNELRQRSDEHFVRDSKYWDLVTGQAGDERLVRQSVAVLLGHIGVNGVIPASLDTDILKFNLDTYAYLWPRDAVMVATALDGMGYWSFTRRLYELLLGELLSEEGFLYHKYNADGTLGSTWHPFTVNSRWSRNIQEDETALAIYGLWAHFTASRDYFLLRSVYEGLERAAEFLVSFRDDRLKLPLASFDLWEERLGTHAFTAATVVAALRAAAEVARTLGVWGKEERWRRAAEEVRKAVLDHMFDRDRGVFYRTVVIEDGKVTSVDRAVDSSVLNLITLGVIDPGDQVAESTVRVVRSSLWVGSVGGLARYENDYYQRVQGDYSGIPGNPWIITTAWLGQYQAMRGELGEARGLLSWIEDAASPTGLLPEQVSPFDKSPLSVMPLAWSHAEYLRAYQLSKPRTSS
ncbi:MAG: glycoside hydrolase family 15 protein [Acidilobus sp.]